MLPEERNPRLNRVDFELRTTGIKPEQANPLRSGIHTRGYLPHVKREGASYFVTFRLGDSLPKSVLFKIQRERAESRARLSAQESALQKNGVAISTGDELRKIERDYFRKMEEYLDKGFGECCLRRPDIAGMVSGALKFFEGERYLLKAWVVMPTHVHVVIWPMLNHILSAILRSWKTYTGREANKLLNRSGQSFWQPEAYDHWVRNEVEHERCCRYVITNPVKAGLCKSPAEWQWSSAWHGK
jgi:REP element-mobilizing transposase RayT